MARKKEEIEAKDDCKDGLNASKGDNFREWYSELVARAELIENFDVSGCYILRPWATGIWNILCEFFDAEIKTMKIQNAYFPLFVSSSVLKKKKDHHSGFSSEVVRVTRSGSNDLGEEIAIRPNSVAVISNYLSTLIRNHRDLPLRLNQWCNVVREGKFSNHIPFIRSREFLCQEGHSAFATEEEADEEVLEILELYRRIYEDFLAVPVIQGKKGDLEKFPGGLYSTTLVAFIPDSGRGVQAATSHCLGQHFARKKAFRIKFENEKGERGKVWQTSWAYTTRTIGLMAMVHGDDKGLVLPPKIAPIQAIVIPVPFDGAHSQDVLDACVAVTDSLKESGIRAEADFRDNYLHWELKGVPVRIEIDPNELADKQVVRLVRRDSSATTDIALDYLVGKVRETLDAIQKNLFDVAKQKRDASIRVVRTWDEFTEALKENRLILAPWCDEDDEEKELKERTREEGLGDVKNLCTPFEQPEMDEGTLCFASGKPAKKWTYWGRSY